jgi:SAM-dependent methyltransferase
MNGGVLHWIGADPGGEGNFGIAIMTGNEPSKTLSVDCADDAITFIRRHLDHTPAGVGVDAPLWTSGRSGDRHMAPEVAIGELKKLRRQSVVLDPMAGSGTVLRQASEFGHYGIGLDMDPLAVLMSKVWTTPIKAKLVERLLLDVLEEARELSRDKLILPWIDEDPETKDFIDYWFGKQQRAELTRLAYTLWRLDRAGVRREKRAAADVLRIALSRIIVTKDKGASLARDVSHSRPHKVATISTFQVVPAFECSVRHVLRLLTEAPPVGNVKVELGDARSLSFIENSSVDMYLTSPPYLNAIDYMRGHKLSLVWLGYRLADLRNIRSRSIGAERAPDHITSGHLFHDIQMAIGPIDDLPRRHASMIKRYAEDIYRLMSEVARVLKRDGQAILVVGNSCLKGVFIKNSDGVVTAGSMVGLKLCRKRERALPNISRYLPIPDDMTEALGKRMRTETVLTFRPA